MMAGAADASPKVRRWSSRRSTWKERFVAALSATGFINAGSVSKSLTAWLRKQRLDLQVAAREYGVSVQMLQYRLNVTGVDYQLGRGRTRARGGA